MDTPEDLIQVDPADIDPRCTNSNNNGMSAVCKLDGGCVFRMRSRWIRQAPRILVCGWCVWQVVDSVHLFIFVTWLAGMWGGSMWRKCYYGKKQAEVMW